MSTVYLPPTSGPIADWWRQWLVKNGVLLRVVVRDTPVWINDDDTFTVVQFVLDERGTRVMHERDCDCSYGDGHLAKKRVTYKMVAQLGPWADRETAQVEQSW